MVKEFLEVDDELTQCRLGMLLGVPQFISEGEDDYSLRASMHSQTVNYVPLLQWQRVQASLRATV